MGYPTYRMPTGQEIPHRAIGAQDAISQRAISDPFNPFMITKSPCKAEGARLTRGGADCPAFSPSPPRIPIQPDSEVTSSAVRYRGLPRRAHREMMRSASTVLLRRTGPRQQTHAQHISSPISRSRRLRRQPTVLLTKRHVQ